MTVKRIFLASVLIAAAIISATALRAQPFVSEVSKQDREAASQAPGEITASGSEFSCSPRNWYECLKERQAQQLEGSWVITVTAVVPPGVPSPPVRTNYTTFSRGGGAVGSDRLAPFANTQHGAWEHRGGNEFIWTFIADNFDAAGNFLGTLKVTSRLTLTGHNEFVGVNSSEIRNAAGNVVFRGCNTLRGQRIQVESVADQCQSIIPPQ
ncbi:MAG TPA: hypothetical protein VFD58_32355 [Blastocatellia bacterium]|nr:hypothetical protein [Blastocatellia bacterium]